MKKKKTFGVTVTIIIMRKIRIDFNLLFKELNCHRPCIDANNNNNKGN